MPEPVMTPYRPDRIDLDSAEAAGRSFFELMDARRSVRFFSDDDVPQALIETAVATASTAPSGAHRQPWRFVATRAADVKRAIREAAEGEERQNYEGGRLPAHWREALAPLGTDSNKSYLERVPWIVVLFEERYRVGPGGERQQNFYVKESVGFAAGLFLASLHAMGLATLTHTPSPMAFLTKVLARPENERPFCLFPIGYASEDCVVPDIRRKPLADVLTLVD